MTLAWGNIVIGQEHRHIVSRLSLAKSEADLLQIASQLRHYERPWIVSVEGGRGVHAPSRFSRLFGGIRPTVSDQLVNALQEVQIGFRLQVQRCGAKRRGMQPRPSFRRDHRSAEMAVI